LVIDRVAGVYTPPGIDLSSPRTSTLAAATMHMEQVKYPGSGPETSSLIVSAGALSPSSLS